MSSRRFGLCFEGSRSILESDIDGFLKDDEIERKQKRKEEQQIDGSFALIPSTKLGTRATSSLI